MIAGRNAEVEEAGLARMITILTEFLQRRVINMRKNSLGQGFQVIFFVIMSILYVIGSME